MQKLFPFLFLFLCVEAMSQSVVIPLQDTTLLPGQPGQVVYRPCDVHCDDVAALGLAGCKSSCNLVCNPDMCASGSGAVGDVTCREDNNGVFSMVLPGWCQSHGTPSLSSNDYSGCALCPSDHGLFVHARRGCGVGCCTIAGEGVITPVAVKQGRTYRFSLMRQLWDQGDPNCPPVTALDTFVVGFCNVDSIPALGVNKFCNGFGNQIPQAFLTPVAGISQQVSLETAVPMTVTWEQLVRCEVTADADYTHLYIAPHNTTHGQVNVLVDRVELIEVDTFPLADKYTQACQGQAKVALCDIENTQFEWQTQPSGMVIGSGSVLSSTISQATGLLATITPPGCVAYSDTMTLFPDSSACCLPFITHVIGTDPDSIVRWTGGAVLNGKYLLKSNLWLNDGVYHLTPGSAILVEGTTRHFLLPPSNFHSVLSDKMCGPVIVLEQNATLIVDEAIITSACDTVWGGIVAFPAAGNRFVSKGNGQRSEISNACQALDLMGLWYGIGDSFSRASYEIEHTAFLNDLAGIRLGGRSTAQDYIMSNRFETDPSTMPYPFKPDSLGTYLMYYALEVFMGEHEQSGLFRQNNVLNVVNGVWINDLRGGVTIAGNSFEHIHQYGIFNYGARDSLFILDNYFTMPVSPVQSPMISPGTGSTGIWCFMGTSQGAQPYTRVIKGNSFWNGLITQFGNRTGIEVNHTQQLLIDSNTFSNMRTGIRNIEAGPLHSRVQGNTFIRTQYGFHAPLSTGINVPDVFITCNTFDQDLAMSDTMYGIRIEEDGVLNDQGDCFNNPPGPCGNKVVLVDTTMWYSLYNANFNLPFEYNRYQQEEGFEPPYIFQSQVNDCGPFPQGFQCSGNAGQGNKTKGPSTGYVKQLKKEVQSMELDPQTQIHALSQIIQYHHYRMECLQELESFTPSLQNVNPTAYLSFAWHMVDCYAANKDENGTNRWLTLVKLAAGNNLEQLDRLALYEIHLKLTGLNESPGYLPTEDDLSRLRQLAGNGRQNPWTEAACVLLRMWHPGEVCGKPAYKEKWELPGTKKTLLAPIQVYPNPTTGRVIIKTHRAGLFRLFNLTGQLVFEVRVEEGSNQIDLRLSESLYIYDMDGNTFGKLVISR